MVPQSPRAHGALHGCAAGAWDAVKSYIKANNSPFRTTYNFDIILHIFEAHK